VTGGIFIHLSLPVGIFPSVLRTKTSYAIRVIYTVHDFPLYLTILKIFSEE